MMQRRNFLQWSTFVGLISNIPVQAKAEKSLNERDYWVSLLDQLASVLVENMSKGELRKNMELAFSPTWDKRNSAVAYMEGFGRLIIGLAPFLDLPASEGSIREQQVRNRLKAQTLLSLEQAANPSSPDYLYWGGPRQKQPLVDAAFIAQALLMAPKTLWEPLSVATKANFIREFKQMRAIDPPKNNWVLFAAMIETFLLSIGEDIDEKRIDSAVSTIQSWYVGDGWYSDGDKFHFDHYNGFVIHPMLVLVLRENVAKGRMTQAAYDLAYKRMQRYATFQERFISPEGTFLVVGRSSTYRTGVFQPLALLALEDRLPEGITPAQVRSALTAVYQRVFIPTTFTSTGWLTLGLVGDQQANIADSYSNTGSMYLTSVSFLPLGLPANHPFWTGPKTDWTQRKAWSGQPFPKDYAVDY